MEITVRPSALPRIFACPSSAAPGPWVESDSEAATLGTALHLVAAAMVTESNCDLGEVAQRAEVDVEELDRLTGSARRIWGKIESLYPRPRVELHLATSTLPGLAGGTADVVHHDGETAAVHDWKSGWAVRSYRHQLLGYAWLIRDAYGMPRSGKIQTSIGWVRSCEIEAHAVTADELDDWGRQFARRLAMVGTVYSPGEACVYCPHRMTCAARRDATASAAAAITGATTDQLADPSALAALYPRVKLLEGAIAEYMSTLRAAVRTAGELEIGDGLVLTLEERRRRKVVPEIAWDMAVGAGLTTEELWSILEIRATELETAVKSHAPRGLKGKAVVAFMERLTAAGGLLETKYQSLATRRKAEEVK